MQELNLLMLGFGNAGRAFAGLLEDKRAEIGEEYGYIIKIIAIVTGSRGSLVNPEGIDAQKALEEIENAGRFSTDGEHYSDITSMDAISTLNYDVVMELTPLNILSGQPAINHIRSALARGKHVITANKGPIAWAYNDLRELAKIKNAQLLFETTVMDGAPVFNMVKDTLPLCKVIEFEGILNSTTNYILEEMEKGHDIDNIMAEGRRRGFVEADPSMDIEGWDAAAKVAALMNVLMEANITPLDIQRKGISEITQENIREARANGNVIKLICRGRIENGKPVGEVEPLEISMDSFLAGIKGTTSVLSIKNDLMKTITVVEHDPDIEQTAYGPFVDLLRILKHRP